MTTNKRVTDFSIAAILGNKEPKVDVDHQLVDPVFPCVNCNKYFTSLLYLRRHRKCCYMKDGPRVTVEPARAPTDMTSLKQVCNGRTVYQCPYCIYKSISKGNIRRHLMTHTGERQFKCDVCGKGFIQKAHLYNHLRTHTGEKPYKCSECEYSCRNSTSLNRHVATKHTGERIYACNLCNYSTADSSNMRNHSNAHTGKKPYHCPYCQYSTNEKWLLTNHIERIHAVTNS